MEIKILCETDVAYAQKTTNISINIFLIDKLF